MAVTLLQPISHEPFIVGHGVDTLKVNVKRATPEGQPDEVQTIDPELEALLAYWQEQARNQGTPTITTIPFHNTRMTMLPNGAPTWKYLVKNDCIQLAIVPRLRIPALAKVTIASSFLWEVGNITTVVEEVEALLYDLFGPPLFLQAAQIDLCVDVAGFTLPSLWEEVFVTHAIGKRPIAESQKDRAVYGGRTLETIMISGHGNPVNFKAYDKVKEIEQRSRGKRFLYDLWRDQGWNFAYWNVQTKEEKRRSTVWRNEFSLERTGLRELGMETVQETILNIPRLWQYCTQDWLRMVTPGAGTNRTRWATAPIWKHIQHAFDDYHTDAITELGPLVRERKRHANIEAGTAALAGYLTTLSAWMLNEAPDSALALDLFNAAYEQVLERWARLGVNVQEVVEKKRKLYHIDP